MQTDVDIAIVGGGLAGLAAAIRLRRQGYSVVVFEKDVYPHHKVCGEYLSMESWNFLTALDLPLESMRLPKISTLRLTAPNGNALTTPLPLGGFGISRYLLDSSLAAIAAERGVQLLQGARVDDIGFDNGQYKLHFAGKQLTAKMACGAYGKRSNLDKKWNRDFIGEKATRLNNYVGVKYHVRTTWPAHLIGLHNFKNGYCGVSKIEDEKFCLCYMTRAENLKANGNRLAQMEENVLFQNPHLKQLFQTSEVLEQFPVTISQISFSQKTKTENGVLLLGDAAGMITPLCGNGMSIALHTAKLASDLVHAYLQQRIPHRALPHHYTRQWQQAFAARLRTGRTLQWFFGSNTLSNLLVGTFKTFPFLAAPLIRRTHGQPF